MRSIRLLALLLAILLAVVAPATAAETTPAIVSGAELLYVRRGPGINYPAFATVARGQAVEVEHLEGTWAFVHLPSGQTGYVHSTYLSFPAETPATVLVMATPIPATTAEPEPTTTASPTTAEPSNTPAEVGPEAEEPLPPAPAPPAPNVDVAALHEEIQQLTVTVNGLQQQLKAQQAAAGPHDGEHLWLSPTSVTLLVAMALLIGWLAGGAYGRQSERSRRSRIRF
jgi:uncharacterized protein YgiM (DUF1202 family)